MSEYKYKEVIKIPNSVRSKMFIVRGFLSHKKVLCFDQPFNYLEEKYHSTFKLYVKEQASLGKGIVITGENENLEGLCNEIITL